MKDLLVPISIAAFISAVLIGIKMVQTRNFSALGCILSRIFVGFVYIRAWVEGGVMRQELIAGILLMFLSDIIYHISYQAYRKKQAATCVEFITRMTDISSKLSTTLDNSLVPFFTINTEGNIEYVNQAFADITGKSINELLGKSLTNELGLDPNVIQELKEYHKRECIIRKANKSYCKAIITGNMTRNGHETITGSIYLI